MDKLSGYRTYILALLVIVAAVLKHFGIIDDATFQTLLVILGGGTAMSLRSGVKKLEKKIEATNGNHKEESQ